MLEAIKKIETVDNKTTYCVEVDGLYQYCEIEDVDFPGGATLPLLNWQEGNKPLEKRFNLNQAIFAFHKATKDLKGES